MARFYGPFNISYLPCSPNPQTLFNPNGDSWSSYYAFNITLNDLQFSDNIFDTNGKLKNNINLVNNSGGGSSGDMGYLQNWNIRINTNNQIQMRYWFWDSGRDRWYWSTSGGATNSAYAQSWNKPNTDSRAPGWYSLGLTITKGHRYNFTVTKPSNMSFKFTLYDIDTGSTQSFQWNACAWNNNYAGKVLYIGANGVSFASGKVSGYPYASNCLHTVTINANNITGSTVKLPITSSCGYSNTLTYNSPYRHKVNVVLPATLANLHSGIKSTTDSSYPLFWENAEAYNTGTRTWTKWFNQDQKLDFPTIWKHINNTVMNGTTTNEGYNLPDHCMFLGFSTTEGGPTINYNDWDSYYMGTSDITLYPVIATFGDLTATTGKGIIDYDGPAAAGGVLQYAKLKPAAANSTIKTVAASGIKVWSNWKESDTEAPYQVTQPLRDSQTIINSTTGGTDSNITPGQGVRGRYIYRLYMSSDNTMTDPQYGDPSETRAYTKTGFATVQINTMLLPVPTVKTQLYYNGANQTQDFNNYETEYMTAQYITNKETGTYTAIFTLKDTVLTHWADDSVEQKTVTWTIKPKVLTPVWGDTTWTFDGQDHETTCTLNGICAGDTCLPTLSNNSIKNPGTKTVSITGVSNVNYTCTGSTTLTVNKKDITLDWSNYEKEYDTDILTPICEPVGYVDGYKPVIAVTSSDSPNLGYYTSNASMTTNSQYYNMPADTTHQLHIIAIPVNIVWAPISKNYDGTTLTSIPTITNLLTGDTCNMTIINNVIGPAASSQIAEVTALSNTNYTLVGSTGRTQVIMIRDVLDPEHGKVYEYDPSKTGAGTAPYNHWILVM